MALAEQETLNVVSWAGSLYENSAFNQILLSLPVH